MCYICFVEITVAYVLYVFMDLTAVECTLYLIQGDKIITISSG